MNTTIQTRQFLEVSTRDKKGDKVWKRIGNREGYELNTPITKMLDDIRGSALMLDTVYRAIAIVGEFKVTQPKPALEVYRTDGTFQYMGNLEQTPVPVQPESDRTALLPSVGTLISFKYIEAEEDLWMTAKVVKVHTNSQSFTVKTDLIDFYTISPKTHVWRVL